MKTNDLVAFTYWAKINKVNGSKLSVTDVDTDENFEVKGQPLIDSAFSADDHNNTEKVTQTQIADRLVKSFNRPLTVNFTKKDGASRSLRGRLLSSEPLLGRSYVQDLDTDDNGTRLVDHRTISRLVVEDVEYVVK
tara:strand:- start:5222 stop:5629 length:408 start_codon:yes stop_codon:yes gene_type:complete